MKEHQDSQMLICSWLGHLQYGPFIMGREILVPQTPPMHAYNSDKRAMVKEKCEVLADLGHLVDASISKVIMLQQETHEGP